MKAEIKKGRASGRITAPPSKSSAHRLIISAGLAREKSTVYNICDSEDILATLDCIKALTGANIQKNKKSVTVSPGNNFDNRLFCRESGSTMRFFIPLCLVNDKEYTLFGSKTLLTRPMTVYEDLCRERGLYFEKFDDCIKVKGPLGSGKFKVRGNISSQFITGLIFALSSLREDSEIEIIPPIDSKPYIDITLQAVKIYGINAVWKNKNTVFIEGASSFKGTDTTVEGDFSNSAFLEALNLLGGNVSIDGLDINSPQGDKIYIEYFQKLSESTPTLDINNCPDLAPILIAMAAAKNGATLTGTSRLKIKESDRGAVMAQELAKFGIKVELFENSITIHGGNLGVPDKVLYGHNDHRIVMSLAILATLTGATIDGVQAASKSYPDFFEDIKKLGIEVNKIDD